jgi:ABC-type multidrug transport system ATPase subunit
MDLQISNLSKTYANGVQALRNVNLTIPQGMFGLLGPNGAGKSSLMRTIATLQEADSGSILLDDMDVLRRKEEVRKVLGYLPQEFGVYPRITAEDMLNHIAVLKGLSDSKQRRKVVGSLLQKVNLYQVRNKNLGTFSGGMKQRFGIAQALLGNPRLIIVDEPTAGLDPAERKRFHNLLSEIGEKPLSFFPPTGADILRRCYPGTGYAHRAFGGLVKRALPLDFVALTQVFAWVIAATGYGYYFPGRLSLVFK